MRNNDWLRTTTRHDETDDGVSCRSCCCCKEKEEEAPLAVVGVFVVALVTSYQDDADEDADEDADYQLDPPIAIVVLMVAVPTPPSPSSWCLDHHCSVFLEMIDWK